MHTSCSIFFDGLKLKVAILVGLQFTLYCMWVSQEKKDLATSKFRGQRGSEEAIHVVFIFADGNKSGLEEELEVCLSSMTKHTTRILHFHVISDIHNWETVALTIKNNTAGHSEYQVSFIDLDQLRERYEETLQRIRFHFGGDLSYHKFNDTIFFLSTRLHDILPDDIDKVIILDVDLKFQQDIDLLHDQFNQFASSNLIGLTWELSPAYRDFLKTYRSLNPGTRFGNPPPEGFPGFNSGVVLLHLARIRESSIYATMLLDDTIKNLVHKFGGVRGYFGDQDFYSLLGLEHEELFHVLPCTFNRQLCMNWQERGYEDVYDLYHLCEGDVVILHGNCKTPFPKSSLQV